MLDRIDIIMQVPQIDIFDESHQKSASSAEIREKIVKARQIQNKLNQYRGLLKRLVVRREPGPGSFRDIFSINLRCAGT